MHQYQNGDTFIAKSIETIDYIQNIHITKILDVI